MAFVTAEFEFQMKTIVEYSDNYDFHSYPKSVREVYQPVSFERNWGRSSFNLQKSKSKSCSSIQFVSDL